MSVNTLAFNPVVTTNAAGSFNAQSDGYIQGQAMDDPSARYRLSGGILASGQTLPIWGGVAIFENTAPQASGGVVELGGNVGRATQIAGATPASGDLTGFAVFDQNYAAVSTPQSPVPVSLSGMQVNFYRLGCRARLALAMDPSLVNLDGNIVTQQVSWDFVKQELVPYTPAYNAVAITGATWASTGGGQTSFTVGTDLTAVLAAGSIIDVSGVVSTGGTGAGYNGNFVVVSVDSTHVVVAQVSASSPGTYSSGGSIAKGGGAVPCKILNTQIGNSMTVSYDAITGFATWNRSGSCALVEI